MEVIKMSVEQNKTLVRNFVEEVWNRGNVPAAGEFFANDFVDHNPVAPNQPAGLAGAIQVFSLYRSAFPDLHFMVEDMVTDGDKVAWRWRSSGTHQGPLMHLPATGKHAVVTGIEIYRIADGKITERWGNMDQLGMLQQLGAIPAPGQAQ
jgi:steroid delta-isomerase-like uncharacterized protein